MSQTAARPIVLDIEASDWRRERRSDGLVKTALRTFHVCLAGGSIFGPCGALIPATRRPLDENSVTAAVLRGDRWYCDCCGARARAKFGVLNEIWHDGLVYWMRSDSPMMEDSSGPSVELAEMIEQVQPHIGVDDMIRLPHVGEILTGPAADVYKVVDPTAFAAMRVWKWSDMLEFIKHF